MNIRQTVLQEGMNIFQRYGIKGLTMEAILGELKISKGTLAEIAKSKEELLEQCIDQTLEQRKNQLDAVITQNTNTLQALQQLLKTHLRTAAGNHPNYLEDLKNDHEECWQKLNDFSEAYVAGHLKKLLELSIEAGLVQNGLDAGLISRLLLAQTNAIIETEIFSTFQFDFDTVFNQGLNSYLRGLATSKGVISLQTGNALQAPSLN
jgi:AcrR family transcriptional regulator